MGFCVLPGCMMGTCRGLKRHVSSPESLDHAHLSPGVFAYQRLASRFDAGNDTSVSNESDVTKSSLLFPRAPWWAVSAAPAGCLAWNEVAVESQIGTVAADR